MKKLMSILLTLTLLASCAAALAEAGTATATPSYLTPSVFVGNYNSLIDMVAEVYADNLGEEGIKILQENYKITQKDIQGTLGYYGSPNWAIEAGFSYPEGIEPTDDTPGQVLNFAIKEGVPEGAVEIVTYALRMIIAYEYQDEALLEKLNTWFAAEKDPANVFELPGYTLNVFVMDGNTQYAILPTAAAYKESVLGKLEQQEPEPDIISGAMLTAVWWLFTAKKTDFPQRFRQTTVLNTEPQKARWASRFISETQDRYPASSSIVVR